MAGSTILVYGDVFEVSCSIVAFWLVFGMEFYFKARETTVEVSRLRSWIYRVTELP
jgi:hypothetical protein